MKKYKTNFNTCIGPSMNTTLKSGDAFILKQTDYKNKLRLGDVIVYPHPNDPVDVVHRVIKLNSDGVITRGDNNNKVDPYLVKFADIRGVVTSIKRGNKTIQILGGTRGVIRHKLMLIRKLFKPYVVYPASMISNVLTASRMFNFIHPILKIKIILIKRNNQAEEIMKIGSKVVGKRHSKNDSWEIIFPYKLFINKKRLP